ncbi:MAG: ester cyclase [bacterium]|nr:ester cyclase [bacterium]
MTHETTITPYDDVLARLSPGPQSMRGFDDDYTDIVAYIIRCTYKIWEKKQTGLIDSHYGKDTVIHAPDGDIAGSETVLANTVQQLALFPDRRLFPEDVVWAGNDEDGFYSSHRIRSTAHHRGFSIYGPPTGKRLTYRVIADCIVKENKILEEWLVRDDLNIIRQMGLNEHEFVAKLISQMPEKFSVTDNERSTGSGTFTESSLQSPKEDGIEGLIKRAWYNAWNLRMFGSLVDTYISTIQCHSASGRELFGHPDIIQFAIDWLACFPDGRMRFDHFCALGDEAKGYRTSLRWTFTGTHTGYGIYGEPSGKSVKIMGITQAHVHGGKILEEWTVFDELNILCQLFVPTEHSEIGFEV